MAVLAGDLTKDRRWFGAPSDVPPFPPYFDDPVSQCYEKRIG